MLKEKRSSDQRQTRKW